MKKESISLKNRLETHVVVLLTTISAAVEVWIHLLDNFYLVISLMDHISHWLEERNLKEINSLESLILNWLTFLFYVTSAQLATTHNALASS